MITACLPWHQVANKSDLKIQIYIQANILSTHSICRPHTQDNGCTGQLLVFNV